MNNFTKYICAGLAIALLIIQAIMIWGLYGNFNGFLNELSDCTRKQLIEREIMLIHLDIRAVPADHLTLDQDIQFILIDNIQRIIIAKR